MAPDPKKVNRMDNNNLMMDAIVITVLKVDTCRFHPLQPVGGHVLAHAVQARVFFKKGSGETRIAKLIDHPSQPEGDATFCLGEGGVADQ